MKKLVNKVFLMSLGLAVVLSTSFASADSVKSDNLKVASKDAIKLEFQKLDGTIKEVGDHQLKVQDKDNKVYIVPVGVFEKMEEYKALDLKVGTAVSLEGFDPGKHQPDLKTEDGKPGHVKTKVMIIQDLKEGELPDVKKDVDGKAEGEVIISEEGMTADQVIPVTPEEAGKALKAESFKEGENKAGETKALEGKGEIRSFSIKVNDDGSGAWIEKLESQEGDLFLPHSVTANGKTVRLVTKSAPVKIMIEKDVLKK
ncbi:MAG: hypothetical protein N2484_00800 [Clostridia bacterium]|nr:hypothetical protein [Clostridia bacterium]